MMYKLRLLFILICIFSVFSFTLQATIINKCKANKVFKSLANSITGEEEEESHDGDEELDKEVLYYTSSDSHNKFLILQNNFIRNFLNHKITSSSPKVVIPPPKL